MGNEHTGKRVDEKFIDGCYGSSYFTIFPCRSTMLDEDWWKKEDWTIGEGVFSIEEDDVLSFLYVLLEPLYDKEHPKNVLCNDNSECFDQWGWNYYTYEQIKVLVSRIERIIEILKEDYENPMLAELKSHFIAYTIFENAISIDKEDRPQYIKENVSVIIGFYKEFQKRIEDLLMLNPEFDMICFMGP